MINQSEFLPSEFIGKLTLYRGLTKGELTVKSDWFASSKKLAQSYADKKGGVVAKFSIEVRNPKVLEFEESTAENIYHDWAKDGFDALIVKQKDGSFTLTGTDYKCDEGFCRDE